jgi:exodeoxyribonuclease VII large subunit
MVQGDGAKEEIASAIALLNEYNEKVAKKKPGENPIDVMIVGRGGGSLEDLWAFNEEVVARAISASAIPVVSAVGHEIDFTISDFVADKRAPTPSAAAEMIVADKKEMISMVENLLGRMLARAKSIVGSKEAELLRLKEAYVLREPVNFILQLKQEIDGLERRIVKGMESLMAGKHNLYDVLKGKLRMLDPESVLERGYSITFRDSRVVKNASDLKSGDRIFTKFARGESGSVVE